MTTKSTQPANQTPLLALIDTMHDALIVTDEAGIIQHVNPQAISAVRDNIPADGQSLKTWLEKTHFSVERLPLPWPHYHMYRLQRDQVLASDREQDRLALLRIIVHDLSNPLNIALNFAELLNQGLLENEERQEAQSILQHQLNRMRELLNDLSLLDQVNEDLSESFATVDIGTIVARAVNDLEVQAQAQQITLTMLPLPTTYCTTHGNERLLYQAIFNLIENAIKYSLPEGWVRVSLHCTPQQIDLLVADNGIGIPPAKQDHLFRAFYRVQDARARQVEGTGLGLNLVKMIAEKHQGSIWHFSAPERGSIFRLRVPTLD